MLLGIVLAMPVLFALRITAVNDPDIWWHLRAGQWIVQHHSPPHTDPFSAFGAGKPWVAYSWLFELGVYGLYQALGLMGIVALNAVLALGVAVAMWIAARQRHRSFAITAALVAAALVAMVQMFAPRPWLLTIIFFISELHIIQTARETGRRRLLWWLVPLFALWANIHIQFVYGFLVLGAAIADDIVSRFTLHLSHSRLRWQDLWLIAAACLSATLLNPYGWRIYQVVREYASEPAVFRMVTEFRPLAFRNIPEIVVLLLTMGAVAALARRVRIDLFLAMLLAGGALISFRSARDVWFVVVVAAIAIVREGRLQVGAENRGANVGHPEQPFPVSRSPLRELMAAVPVVVALAALALGARHINNVTLERQVAVTYPAGAAQAIEHRGYAGPLYNHFNWGGYLIWRLPALPVAMDGRTNVHGAARIARSMSTWDGEPAWHEDPELAAAGVVVAGVKDPLFANLCTDTRFQLAYRDAVAGVFVARRGGIFPQVSAEPRDANLGHYDLMHPHHVTAVTVPSDGQKTAATVSKSGHSVSGPATSSR